MLKEVAKLAGVKVRWRYNMTTIDPPELIRFIKEHHPDVEFVKPEKNFFTVGVQKGFPSRLSRWCCDVYKEGKEPKGASILVGIRGEESPSRRKRYNDLVHKYKGRILIAPLFHVDSEDLWTFIRGREIPYCSLYDEGFHRLGCVGCPMGGKIGRKKEFARWPKYEFLWKKMFRKIWEERSRNPIRKNGRKWKMLDCFNNWEEMWDWWLNDKPLPKSK